MNRPPRVIWLQFYGEDEKPVGEVDVSARDVCWCADKIFDTDVRYIIDKRQIRKKSKPEGQEVNYIWVVEMWTGKKWKPTTGAFLTRSEARNDIEWFWMRSSPDDKYRVVKYWSKK